MRLVSQSARSVCTASIGLDFTEIVGSMMKRGMKSYTIQYAIQLSMIVETTSCTLNFAFRRPEMNPHTAPAAIDATMTSGM